MPDWQTKVALVTGGSGGLGLAIARELVSRQAKVVIVARTPETLETAAAELRAAGGDVLAVQADIRQPADVDRMLAETVGRFGRLDVLVNNAGRSARGAAIDTPAEEFADMFDLNVTALVRCTRAALPQLLANGGSLVNIGSLAGKTAARYMGAYSATKHAVSAYSQQLRLELGPQGLHVLLVSPGPIARDKPRTYGAEKLDNLPASARQPGAGVNLKLIDPKWLAKRIVQAIDKRQLELVVPGKARIVFAVSALSPSLGDWLIRKMS